MILLTNKEDDMGLIVRKCWSCHKNVLTSKQILEGLPCVTCQEKNNLKVKAPRVKKPDHSTPYIPLSERNIKVITEDLL